METQNPYQPPGISGETNWTPPTTLRLQVCASLATILFLGMAANYMWLTMPSQFPDNLQSQKHYAYRFMFGQLSLAAALTCIFAVLTKLKGRTVLPWAIFGCTSLVVIIARLALLAVWFTMATLINDSSTQKLIRMVWKHNDSDESVEAVPVPKSDAPTNRAGFVGFCCSISGLAGMIGGLVLSALIGVSGVFHVLIAISLLLCAIGLVASLAGIFFVPRRLAVWGAIIGLLGSMNIQTFWLAYVHSR